MNTATKPRTSEVSSFLVPLGFNNDPRVNFRKSWNGLNYHREPENINHTIMEYGETFYGRHTALIPALVKKNRF